MQSEYRFIKCAALYFAILAGPLYGGAEFTSGESPTFQCVLDSISHDFAPLSHRYRLMGRCTAVGSDGKVSYEAWANPITWESSTEWNEETHEVGEQIKTGDGRLGRLKAICPADPVVYSGHCTGVQVDGNIYQAGGFSYHLNSVLISREVVPEAHKSALRQQLESPYPPPQIGSPIANYFYDQAFRGRDGNYSVPLFVSIPYRAALLVTIESWVPNLTEKSGNWQGRKEEIDLSSMQKTEYGDAVSYAGRLSLNLAPGKHRIVAQAVAGNNWNSRSSEIVVFWVFDEKSMQESVQAQAKQQQFPKIDRSAMQLAAKQDSSADLTPAAFRTPVKSGAVQYSGETQSGIADITRLVVMPASTPATLDSKHQIRRAMIASGLLVDRIVQRDGPIAVGQPVDLRVVFRNAGAALSDPNTRYSVTCTIQSGQGNCPITDGAYPIGVAVEPGGRHSAKLAGPMAEAGKYLITVTVPTTEKGKAATGNQLQHIVEVGGLNKNIPRKAAKSNLD